MIDCLVSFTLATVALATKQPTLLYGTMLAFSVFWMSLVLFLNLSATSYLLAIRNTTHPAVGETFVLATSVQGYRGQAAWRFVEVSRNPWDAGTLDNLYAVLGDSAWGWPFWWVRPKRVSLYGRDSWTWGDGDQPWPAWVRERLVAAVFRDRVPATGRVVQRRSARSSSSAA